MSEKTKQKKLHPISFRPPIWLREQLIHDALMARMSLNAHLTKLCSGQRPKNYARQVPVEEKMVGQWLRGQAVSKGHELDIKANQVSIMDNQNIIIDYFERTFDYSRGGPILRNQFNAEPDYISFVQSFEAGQAKFFPDMSRIDNRQNDIFEEITLSREAAFHLLRRKP